MQASGKITKTFQQDYNNTTVRILLDNYYRSPRTANEIVSVRDKTMCHQSHAKMPRITCGFDKFTRACITLS